ncbi:MAG: PHP domain-containing protein [Nitrospinae bacterium]|nr:PHP domain-containing protein [Nitrospinota bacterium]
MARIDLHLHTTYSDGSVPPAEVVSLAHKASVTALAITDHDIVDGIPEALEAGTQLGVEVIPGIEISSRWEEKETHILGYFLKWQDPELQKCLADHRISRHTRNPQIVEKLNKFGLSLTYDEVKAKGHSASIGRPHIAQVLVEKGYVNSVKEAFDRYLGVGGDAYIPRELPEAREAIDWIRKAGGVPVLAHPGWTKQKGEDLKKFCKKLKEAGLLGIEVFYSTHHPRQTSEYLGVARHLDLLVTGGSDFHGVTKPGIEVGIGRGNLKVPEKLLEPLKNAACF